MRGRSPEVAAYSVRLHHLAQACALQADRADASRPDSSGRPSMNRAKLKRNCGR